MKKEQELKRGFDVGLL